jgi:hypothetical protein
MAETCFDAHNITAVAFAAALNINFFTYTFFVIVLQKSVFVDPYLVGFLSSRFQNSFSQTASS